MLFYIFKSDNLKKYLKPLYFKGDCIITIIKQLFQEIELKNEELSKKNDNKKLELQKKQNALEIMKFIMDYHQKEMKEKVQFYHNNIIQPLELKQVFFFFY